MESKLNDIEIMKLENPIFAFVQADNLAILRKKALKGIPHYEFDVLIKDPKQFYTLTCQIIRDPIKCMKVYKTLDISDLYTFYAYNLAINYEPYVEEK